MTTARCKSRCVPTRCPTGHPCGTPSRSALTDGVRRLPDDREVTEREVAEQVLGAGDDGAVVGARPARRLHERRPVALAVRVDDAVALPAVVLDLDQDLVVLDARR